MPDALERDDATKNHVEWGAVEEGFRLLERDIGKLQVDRIASLRLSVLTTRSPLPAPDSNS